MENEHIIEFWVSKHFICYLGNGDASNLDIDEMVEVDRFIDEQLNGQTIGCLSFGQTEEHDNFQRCEITKEQADCFKLLLHTDLQSKDYPF